MTEQQELKIAQAIARKVASLLGSNEPQARAASYDYALSYAQNDLDLDAYQTARSQEFAAKRIAREIKNRN